MIKPDGTDLAQLTDIGNNEDPSFSPDGRYITFSSDRTGRGDLYHAGKRRDPDEDQPPGTPFHTARGGRQTDNQQSKEEEMNQGDMQSYLTFALLFASTCCLPEAGRHPARYNAAGTAADHGKEGHGTGHRKEDRLQGRVC